MSIGDRGFIWLQYLLPQHALTWVVHQATRWTWRPWKNLLIRLVTRAFRIDLAEAARSELNAYPNFNAFFTRALKPGARPMDAPDAALISPADGMVSQLGHVEQGQLLQAKGRTFALLDLLAGDHEWCAQLSGGRFITIYLSPRDYHRVHMPLSARLTKTTYVPGRLFSVDQRSTRAIAGIFARNERLISYFQSAAGPLAVVMVGAMLVSAIDTVWQAPVPPARAPRHQHFAAEHSPSLARGAEMGRFNMGSTVILVVGNATLRWQAELAADRPVRMGEWIGTYD